MSKLGTEAISTTLLFVYLSTIETTYRCLTRPLISFGKNRINDEANLFFLLSNAQLQGLSPALIVTPQKKSKLNSIINNNPESNEEESPEIELTRTYSARELLREKDFAELSAEEIRAVKEMMTELLWQLGQQRTRRHKPGSGNHIDLRRSLRQSLRNGGEILEWSYRRPKYRPRPLVIIADISGSMERYTRMLLHFIYSLRKGADQPIEAFLFGTRLTRITRQLRDSNVDRAMEEVSRAVPDWSGGTRIGQALRRFNFDWARRVLGQGAIVLMISDGWDRGDPNLLADEIARLQRSSFRLIWLNPLLGSADYEPLTRGMQAALPYVDDFLAVHNLASIEELAIKLMQLKDRRSSRRQQLSMGVVF